MAPDPAASEEECDHCGRVDCPGCEEPDTCLNSVDGHWYVITYGYAPYQIHARDCETCRHRHTFDGQTLDHAHPHDGPHGYFGHAEDPLPHEPSDTTGTYRAYTEEHRDDDNA